MCLRDKYLDVNYDEKNKPITNYPDLLAKYLYKRFEFNKDMILLDNECGRGDFLNAFARLGMTVYGTDLVNNNMRKGEMSNIFNVNLEKEKLPFKDDYFDIIFTKSIIEHILNPSNFMEECHRVLKPGERIICMTPDWKTTFLIFYNDCTHVRPYTKEGLKNLLQMYDFNLVESEEFYHLPILWKYSWLKIISKLIKLIVL